MTTQTPDAVREAIIAAITKADANFGYSYRLTKMDDTGEEHTLFMDGFEPAVFQDREDGYPVIEQRRNEARTDAILAALDSRAVMNAASDLRDFADQVMEAAANCCTDPDAGPSSQTSVSFTGEEGARIANDLHRLIDSRAGDAGEGLQSAVADTLNAAWALCDDTENGDSDRPSVPRDAWKRLADALDALEAIIPKNEQPCWPGAAARLLATRDPAVSGLQPVAGHAEGCGVHDDYDCNCPATRAPAVDAVPAGEVAEQAHAAVRDGDYRIGYLRMCEAYGKLAALSHGEGRK